MFWILIPVWVTWAITEFIQEKHGTDFSNAISNGAIALFASVDWTRYLFRLLESGFIRFTFGVFLKFFVAIAVFAYGIYVIYLGIKRHSLVSFLGKIRWVTYLLVMFTPIVYNVIRMNVYTLFAIIVFFPLYWWIVEAFDRIIPDASPSQQRQQYQRNVQMPSRQR